MSTDRARTTSTERLCSDRAERIAVFYSQHATSLQRSVRRRLRAPRQTVEDACQTA